jgi:hypothetical protein
MPILSGEVNVSDLHATERIIGGLIVVGVASLLSWNHAQGNDPGLFGMVLIGAMVLGGLWAGFGLIELIFGSRGDSGIAAPQAPDQSVR